MVVKNKSADPRTSYRHALDMGQLQPDQRQFEVVGQLQDLYERLVDAEQGVQQGAAVGGFWGGLFTNRKPAFKPLVKGVYLWGGVGRGKTLLCDMFFDGLPFENKKRIHFHRFMRLVHQQLATIKHEESPLEIVSDTFASQMRVLVLDEMHVNDITDAMLMSGLLQGLFARGVTLVTTSNLHPDDLYREGLQRASFLPAIEQIKVNTEVIYLGGDVDYRLRVLENAEIFYTPLDDFANSTLEAHFHELVAAASFSREGELSINDRQLKTVMHSDDIAWFGFDELCNSPRSTDDYIEIARLYGTVMISDVPAMDHKSDDQARRFANLVDEFYDRNVKLIVTAAVEPSQLYSGQRLEFEFERTVSRLIEMQSTEYLAGIHQP